MRSVAESGMMYTIAALVVLICETVQAYAAVVVTGSFPGSEFYEERDLSGTKIVMASQHFIAAS